MMQIQNKNMQLCNWEYECLRMLHETLMNTSLHVSQRSVYWPVPLTKPWFHLNKIFSVDPKDKSVFLQLKYKRIAQSNLNKQSVVITIYFKNMHNNCSKRLFPHLWWLIMTKRPTSRSLKWNKMKEPETNLVFVSFEKQNIWAKIHTEHVSLIVSLTL